MLFRSRFLLHVWLVLEKYILTARLAAEKFEGEAVHLFKSFLCCDGDAGMKAEAAFPVLDSSGLGNDEVACFIAMMCMHGFLVPWLWLQVKFKRCTNWERESA